MANEAANSIDPEALARFRLDAEARAEECDYRKSESDRPKDISFLARTKLLVVAVQTVHEGGKNNLHYHMNGDQCCIVPSGWVRLHGCDDVVYGEFGARQGMVVRAGTRYWFEEAGEEELEVLQCFGIDKENPTVDRIEITLNKAWMTKKFMSYKDNSWRDRGPWPAL